MKASLLAFIASLWAVAAHPAEPLDTTVVAEMRAVLAPTGTLRAAFLGSNPVQGRVDPDTGAVTGPVADLVEELAKRLEVRPQLIATPDARTLIGHLEDQSADIGFLAYDASRATVVDFAGPYAVMLNSYVVANAAPLTRSADADRVGQVIGAVRGQAQELFVSSQLRNARVRVFDRQPPQPEMEALLASGELTAFAMNRQRAVEMDRASATLRALPDSFLEVVQSFVVLKGEQRKRELLDGVVAQLRSSGFVERSLDAAGLKESTRVAGALPQAPAP